MTLKSPSIRRTQAERTEISDNRMLEAAVELIVDRGPAATSLKEVGLIDLRIILITSDSVFPVFCSISSKVILSAQAAQIIQSGSDISGSGFLTLVMGV